MSKRNRTTHRGGSRQCSSAILAASLILGPQFAPIALAAPPPDFACPSADANPTCPPYDRSDADNDGMSNNAEYNFGTDPQNADSDRDGLTDPDEVHKHNTDPWNPNTDGDGESDYFEITNGADPLVSNASPPARGGPVIPSATVERATDVWDKPSHQGGQKILVNGEAFFLVPGDRVILYADPAAPDELCDEDSWCWVSNSKIPNEFGKGAVWGGDLEVQHG